MKTAQHQCLRATGRLSDSESGRRRTMGNNGRNENQSTARACGHSSRRPPGARDRPDHRSQGVLSSSSPSPPSPSCTAKRPRRLMRCTSTQPASPAGALLQLTTAMVIARSVTCHLRGGPPRRRQRRLEATRGGPFQLSVRCVVCELPGHSSASSTPVPVPTPLPLPVPTQRPPQREFGAGWATSHPRTTAERPASAQKAPHAGAHVLVLVSMWKCACVGRAWPKNMSAFTHCE